MRVVVIDFESTGLRTKETIENGETLYPAEIIEIGATEIVNGKIVKNMSRLVKPKNSIPSNVTKINNISDELVANEKSIEEVLPKFRAYLGDSLVVAHNGIRFDFPLVNYYLRKMNLPEITNVLDTMVVLKNEPTYTEQSNSLATACQFYGIKNTNAHRAYADTMATAKLYLILEGKKPQNQQRLF